MRPRSEASRELESQVFDVCVIGGGATGAGCALDAQLRGFKTALVEAGDFGSATSSTSTKLAHGGVRYLQQAVTQFDFAQLHIVRQALRERKRMLENAPHLARCCDFLVPCFSRWDCWYYGLGLRIYDGLAGPAALGRSRRLSRRETLVRMPELRGDALHGSVVYQDGQFDDARYCLALVKSFSGAAGAATNYVKVVGFEKGADGKLAAALARDAFSGAQTTIRARAFVNATGPFSDSLRSLANPSAEPRLILSKGAHILLPLEREQPALLIPRTEDGRVIFALPWMGRLLLGTTDERVAHPDGVSVTRQDAEYLLSHLNRYCRREYALSEIVGAFAGVRPLLGSAHGRSTKDLVREHEIEIDSTSGLISILGGKWTSYRVMAEGAIDRVQEKLGKPGACRTRDYRLAGGEAFGTDLWQEVARDAGLPEATARRITNTLGTEAKAILSLIGEHPEWRTPLTPDASRIQAEVIHCARSEMAVTVEDVLARRLGLQFIDWELAMQAAAPTAELLGAELGWPIEQRKRAAQEFVARVQQQITTVRAEAAANG
ncbi:MAG TPA: glycerol-3-phosphate dehydrogenase/oxidase [Steroidobacteraceae bacterium]|jgi:glycerol-3-phosphate dehydrogenase|nr:glycerol-3-phosphate dehydrogenase/oxidase [Steroidobacteraceae bacterium]